MISKRPASPPLPWLLALTLALPLPLPAAAEAPPPMGAMPVARILDPADILVDHTVTRVGQEFFQLLAQRWHAAPARAHAPIVVREVTAGTRGSQLSIEYRLRPLLRLQLGPLRAALDAQAAHAAEALRQSINDAEVGRALHADRDLAPEEL